ncbi:hypothetical protein CI610_02931 [invertebrate metagenome]|uniref:Reverse transcriptase zinc-binding domain-containing protein n=1 Tax=invertebrate metagenome TaxID=1711999 RepID=A0A2H9T4K6_9ZZZZ
MKYWLKLLKTNNCVLKSCYDALVELNNKKPNCKSNWVYHIKNELCSLGFGYIWNSQYVLNENHFMQVYVQRVHDVFIQELRSAFDISSKCYLYKHIVDTFNTQFYLIKPIDYKFKKLLSQFRMQGHSLNIESGRYNKIPRSQRICTVCDKNDVEDEVHFVLLCPAYSELRKTYIKKYYYSRPSVYKLIELFSSKSVKTLNRLGKFLLHATAERKTLLVSN